MFFIINTTLTFGNSTFDICQAFHTLIIIELRHFWVFVCKKCSVLFEPPEHRPRNRWGQLPSHFFEWGGKQCHFSCWCINKLLVLMVCITLYWSLKWKMPSILFTLQSAIGNTENRGGLETFKFRLNDRRHFGDVTSDGSLYKVFAAETGNARSPPRCRL